jgi:hypothetical protein
MKGTQITLSTGTVVTLGLRGDALVAHAAGKTQAENKGAIIERPVNIEDLAGQLGLVWANMTQADVATLTNAVGAAA